MTGPDDVYLDTLLGAIPDLTVERSPATRTAEGFDLAEVAVASAQRLEASPGDEVLVGAEATPLLVRGQRHGRPFAYLGFPLGHSNLALQVAFPVLGDRLVGGLAGASLPPTDLQVGAALPLAGSAGGTVEGPGGDPPHAPPGSGAAGGRRSRLLGGDRRGTTGPHRGREPGAGESALAPVATLPVEPRPAAPEEAAPRGEEPLLAALAAVLLAVMADETWVSRRRMGVGRRQGRLALSMRAVIAVLVVGALLGVELPRTRGRVATVFVLDASDSLGQAGRAEALAWTQEALANQPPGALAGVALFGGDARLELTVQEKATLLTPSVQVDTDRTDLADAGVAVEVHPVTRAGGADVAVTGLDAPSLAREGEEVPLVASVTATDAGPALLTLRRDGAVVEERVVDLDAGANRIDLAQVAGASGLARYQVEVDASGDTVGENDVAFAAVAVEGPARVLVAEGTPGEATTLAEALRAGGLPTDVVDAPELPPLDQLATYSATVLVDVDLRALSPPQLADLQVATRDLGRGLVVIGGERSYALGGYLDSPLEELLPVVSDVLDPSGGRRWPRCWPSTPAARWGRATATRGPTGWPAAGTSAGRAGSTRPTSPGRPPPAASPPCPATTRWGCWRSTPSNAG